MRSEERIMRLLCLVDDKLAHVSQGHQLMNLYPSEIVTIGILFTLKGVHPLLVAPQEESEEMSVILSNVSWMSFNVFLALIAVLFRWCMKRMRWKLLRIVSGVVWIIFLPNTLYLVTDIVHFFPNMHRVEGVGKLIVVFQYLMLLLLGVSTYFAAMYPAEKDMREKSKWNQIIFILLINGLVSFGITLGRVERTNSWYFVTDPPRILHDSMHLLASLNFVFLILLFTLLSTLLYFSLLAILPLLQPQRDR